MKAGTTVSQVHAQFTSQGFDFNYYRRGEKNRGDPHAADPEGLEGLLRRIVYAICLQFGEAYQGGQQFLHYQNLGLPLK
jgi:hypothetical protein